MDLRKKKEIKKVINVVASNKALKKPVNGYKKSFIDKRNSNNDVSVKTIAI